MDFNKWYEKRDYLLRVTGYAGNTETYFEQLKEMVDELGLNEELKHLYLKRNGSAEAEKFYFFYEEKVVIVSLNSLEVTLDEFYLSDLVSVRFKTYLNADYKDKLILKLKDKMLTLDPIQDTEASEYLEYKKALKQIYLLVK